jgi:hypothetical protein
MGSINEKRLDSMESNNKNWGLTAKEQSGVSVWNSTERKHQNKGFLTKLT